MPSNRLLLHAVELARRGDTAQLVSRRDQVDRMDELRTQSALVGDPVGPAALAVLPRWRAPSRSSFGGSQDVGAADDAWFASARVDGFASGEAIIAKLGGYHRRDDDDIPLEKRAFVIETEFSRLLQVNNRDGSTASPILRRAWDEGRLQHIRAKQELVAEGAHLSLLGHITPDELRARLTATDVAGGFANRCLFAYVDRAQRLPSPRPLAPMIVGALAKRLRAAMDFARERRVLERTPEAEAVWAEFYNGEPERDGIVGELTARSAAQRLRLSVACALLDRSDVIRPEHVIAAEAAGRYCADSAEHVFGGLSGDAVQDRLLAELRRVYPGGLDGAAQHALFARNLRAERLVAARRALERRGVAITDSEATGGRERLVSYAVRTNENIRNKDRDELFVRLSSYVRSPRDPATR